jgi:Ca-activated chloride channel family protein
MEASTQQQESEDGQSESQDARGPNRSTQKSDGDEQPEEASEDGRSGNQRSDSGNDEMAQEQHSAFGDNWSMEDSRKGKQEDDTDTSATDSGDETREAGGSSAQQQAQGGGEQAGDARDGINRDLRGQQAGEANDPRDFDPARANMNTGAIEQFDQLGRRAGPEGEDEAMPGETPGAGGRSTVIVMEQLLDQVEGNPAYLIRNQFMLEEQRMNQNGGRAYEPRPW